MNQTFWHTEEPYIFRVNITVVLIFLGLCLSSAETTLTSTTMHHCLQKTVTPALRPTYRRTFSSRNGGRAIDAVTLKTSIYNIMYICICVHVCIYVYVLMCVYVYVYM